MAFWKLYERGVFYKLLLSPFRLNFLPSLGMRLTDPRPLKQICDWSAVFITSSSSFPEAQRSNLKALIGRRKSLNDESRAAERSYRLMVSSRQRKRRGTVSWGRRRHTLKELFVALIERIGELTEHLVHEARLLLLELVLMPPSSAY